MIHELFEPGGVDRVTSDIRNARPLGLLILLGKSSSLQIVVVFPPWRGSPGGRRYDLRPGWARSSSGLGCIISSSFIFVLVHKLGALFVQAMVPRRSG